MECQQGPELGRVRGHSHTQLTWSNKGGSHGGGGEKETAQRNVVERKKVEVDRFEDVGLEAG